MRYKRHRKQASLNGFSFIVVSPDTDTALSVPLNSPRAAGHKNGGGELKRGCLSSHK